MYSKQILVSRNCLEYFALTLYIFITYYEFMEDLPKDSIDYSYLPKPRFNRKLFLLTPAVLILIVVLLIFFDIIPLSFNTKQANTQNVVPTPQVNFKFKLICPMAINLCSTGRSVDSGDFSGLGYTLPEGTQLVAVFDGNIVETPKVNGRSPSQPLIYLRNSQNQTAIYSYYGTAKVKIGDQVKVGAEIGKVSKEVFPVPPLAGLNLLFSFRDMTGYQKITTESFIKQ